MNRLKKIWHILTKSGFSVVYKTIKTRIKRLFIKTEHTVLIYKESDLVLPLLKEVTYDKYSLIENISEKIKQQINNAIGEQEADKLFSLFEKNALFWVIMIDEVVIGYWWSISNKYLDKWYMQLENEDVVFFSAIIFLEWRGRSISPTILNRIIKNEIKKEVSVYLDVETWNESAQSAWLKAGFIVLGTYPSI